MGLNLLVDQSAFDTVFFDRHRAVVQIWEKAKFLEYKLTNDTLNDIVSGKVDEALIASAKHVLVDAEVRVQQAQFLHKQTEVALIRFVFDIVNLLAEKNPVFSQNASKTLAQVLESGDFNLLKSIYVAGLVNLPLEAKNMVETTFLFLESEAELKFVALDKAFKLAYEAKQIADFMEYKFNLETLQICMLLGYAFMGGFFLYWMVVLGGFGSRGLR